MKISHGIVLVLVALVSYVIGAKYPVLYNKVMPSSG